MITTSKVPTNDILSPEEVRKLDDSLDELLKNYQSNNYILKLEWIIPILGGPPVIPSSPDMDARMDAFDELVEYDKKKDFIENFLIKELG